MKTFSCINICLISLYCINLSFIPRYVNSQSLSLFGLFNSYLVPIDKTEQNVISSTCFSGIGFTTCVPNKPADDDRYSNELLYLQDLAAIRGTNYCLQCCGAQPDRIDVWDLICTVDYATVGVTNYFGYELRLATHKTATDTGYITCPLRRTACKYSSSGKTLSCNRASADNYLVGYTLTITVQQYDANFQYWRGASYCEIETIEANSSLKVGETFHEKIIMKYSPKNGTSLDLSKLFLLLLFLLIIIYGLLYCCRNKRCAYCQKKLVLSTELCYICQALGVQLPDPVLIQAMEEKGQKIQGDLPDPYPCMKFWCSVGGIINYFICFRFLRNIKIFPSSNNANDYISDSSTIDIGESKDYEMSERSFKIKQNISEKNAENYDTSKKSKKKKKVNPNILPYSKELIRAAVNREDPKTLTLEEVM
eukprot:gene10395-13962_t